MQVHGEQREAAPVLDTPSRDIACRQRKRHPAVFASSSTEAPRPRIDTNAINRVVEENRFWTLARRRR
eukprot:3125839-Pleurochrysis_carterae.AAC.1